ncbi:NFAT activation molecule 1 [Gracilinanus agilis]|uniref:NFAT activation molecule 1 n=1 Tax=Gracilinanus agilis TaxID=191870 RepID=UPI001CFEDF36|nr:NFAT activation molecule 1 [Gracilinanus agilis]
MHQSTKVICALAAAAAAAALQVAGALRGQFVTHLDAPIQVTLAHQNLSLVCKVTYQNTPTFKNYRFSYYHIDLEGRQSPSTFTSCRTSPGLENQTHWELCPFTLIELHDVSATGTYYCQAQWSSITKTGSGIFVLVRDSGYKEPPEGPKKLLLLTFTGLLTVLSILGTGLLLWKAKKQRSSARKLLKQKAPGRAGGSTGAKPDQAGSIYTALQPHQPDAYDCLRGDGGRPAPQGQRREGPEELNAIYENF